MLPTEKKSGSALKSESNKGNILILNHDRLSQRSLFELLSGSGYKVDSSSTLKECVSRLEENEYNLLLADTDGVSAAEINKIMKDRSISTEVVMLTSHGKIGDVFTGVRNSSSVNYLVKPFEDDEIMSIIHKVTSGFKKIVKEKMAAPKSVRNTRRQAETFYNLVGQSQSMKDIYQLIERVSNTKTTMLLCGESGTGKRMIARAIHQADKKRKDKPFIEISCGALPREIIESELFGHIKGAFTGAIADRKGRFELADGGTILLDDIDCFSLDLQVKLLRILQEKEFERVGDHRTMKVDVRVIASTNQDINKAVAEKRFREDLFYRLNVISINIPPLRERKDDLELFVDHFIDIYTKENHKKVDGVAQETLNVLKMYNWPGNARELENIIERAVILDTNGIIENDDLPEAILSATRPIESITVISNEPQGSSLRAAMQEPEKIHILRVLKEVGWNKKKAAMKLGVNRTTLYNKLRHYNIAAKAPGV